jgi:hypothetical protein
MGLAEIDCRDMNGIKVAWSWGLVLVMKLQVLLPVKGKVVPVFN